MGPILNPRSGPVTELDEVQMDGELLRVSGLLRRFGDHEVLHGVSFEIRPGQAVAVVGPNGSGKSTLLQCVLGSQQPDGPSGCWLPRTHCSNVLLPEPFGPTTATAWPGRI